MAHYLAPHIWSHWRPTGIQKWPSISDMAHDSIYDPLYQKLAHHLPPYMLPLLAPHCDHFWTRSDTLRWPIWRSIGSRLPPYMLRRFDDILKEPINVNNAVNVERTWSHVRHHICYRISVIKCWPNWWPMWTLYRFPFRFHSLTQLMREKGFHYWTPIGTPIWFSR